jgi:hypothetical protein
MTTPIENFWNQLKVSAAEHGARGEPLPSSQAEAIVTRLLRHAGVSPWPPDGVIAFYTSELLGMVDAIRLRKNTSARMVS